MYRKSQEISPFDKIVEILFLCVFVDLKNKFLQVLIRFLLYLDTNTSTRPITTWDTRIDSYICTDATSLPNLGSIYTKDVLQCYKDIQA